MYEPGKLHDVANEMQRLNLNILGVCKVRWLNSGQITTENGVVVYYSGSADAHHRHGVAINKTTKKYI